MKRASLLLVAVALLLPASAMAGPKASCTVSPSTVSLSGDLHYTVTFLAEQEDRYQIDVSQSGHGQRTPWFAHIWPGETSVLLLGVDGRLDPESRFALWPGEASIRVERFRRKGQAAAGSPVQIATCSLTVIE